MNAASLALVICLPGQVTSATGGATGPAWIRPVEPGTASPAVGIEEFPRRRFVFGFLGGVTAGLSVLPSVELAFFFGGRLPDLPWTLGYQLTLASGFADRYFAGLATHRHHLTAQRRFGARERGFVAVGGGVALLWSYPVAEAEGRVGVRFGKRRRGVFGGLARVGWTVLFDELAPVPQLGLFVGTSTL
jgi:hypothetical protein